MPLNPVVIAGSLSKEELEKSIKEIVNAVDSGMDDVSQKFDTKLAAIEENFKTAGTKIGTAFKDSFNAALGSSFDQLAAAMEKMSKASAKGTNAANAANASGAVTGAKNKNITYPEDSIGELRQQIKELQTKLNYEKKSTSELQKQVDLLHQAKAELKTQTTSRTFDSVFGMREDSLSQISAKLRAYKSVTAQTADEQKRIRDEYQRLSQRQKELLGTTKSLANWNSALARSFGHIRNRLIYALTIGSVMNFVKQMYSVRAEYELLERSMGVLIDNFRRGSEIFNELNAMALKSPFTLVELGTAAKQLLAYNFAEDEVVDTTRRLADISAALGVPMERLVYNLGQIRAQTVLTARDARDFANAGLAIVPMLAKMYTEQKKFGDEIVTTAQVYDMMSKKLVTYEDVMKVINQVTDEGGKFFDFQAKQAETLKVQLANLTLAWNNMLNDIASGHQTALNTPIKLVKSLFQNWRSVLSVIQSLIVAYGIYKTAILAVNSAHAATWALRLQVRWKQYTEAILAATGAMNKLKVAIGTSGLIGLASILAGVASYFLFFKDSVGEAADDIKRFGEAGAKAVRNVENLYTALSSINKTSGNYKKIMGELNQALEDYGLELVNENFTMEQLNVNREKNIELLKQEALEREHLNNIEREREKYETADKDERAKIEKTIASYGGAWEKYAPAISSIVANIFEENIDQVTGKTGHEFNQAARQILDKVREEIKKNPVLSLEIDEESLKRAVSIYNYNGIVSNLTNLKLVKEATEANIAAENAYNEEQKKRIGTQTTLNDRIEQSSTLLISAANDTDKFYRKIDALVKQYSGKNIIDFLIDVKAKVPDWMMKMGVDDLSKLAARFTSIASEASKAGFKQKNVNGTIWDVSDIYLQGALYAEALRQKTAKKEEEDTKKIKQKKDELGDALTKELQLITDIQKLYKEYTKADINQDEAKIAAAKEYQKTLEQTNKTLAKFGVQGLTGEQLATMDLRAMRDYYQSILDKVQSSPKAVEALEKAIRNLNIEITKQGQKTIIDSLNNELSKIKDEYELAVELDANPELGENFATMFGIVPEALPHTIQEYAERTLDSLNNALKKGKQSLQLPSLFLTPDDINILSELVKEEKLGEEYFKAIMAAYNKFVGALKSASTDVEKVISDHIKNYGDLSERLKEIENEKNENLKKLNAEYYTDELKQTEEYAKKRNIILDKANKDIAKATFDALKRSDDYERFFMAIDTLTEEDAIKIKKEIKNGIVEAFKGGALNVQQFRKEIKALETQFDSLTKATSVWGAFMQNGYDGAIKRAKEVGQELEYIGEKIKVENKIDEKDKNYLNSLGKIFTGKDGSSTNFSGLMEQFGKDMNGLGKSVSSAGSGMNSAAGKFASTVAVIDTIVKNIHGMVEGINQIFNELNEGRNEDSKIGGWGWDAFSKVDQYAASGWEKLKSGNIMGATTDTISSIIAPIVAIFRKADKDITDKIKKSELEVEKLGIAYDSLSDKADKAYGVLSSGARRAAIENKRLQLAEVQRQLQLEKSRAKKYQDEDKIVQLEGKVESLRREINNTTSDVINDMLGISSAGDGVTNLVQVMIDAFKQGEDAMVAFGDEWDKMIDNMILRLIISKYVQDTWDNIMKTLKNKEDEMLGEVSSRAAKAESEMIRIRNMSDEEFLNEFFSNYAFAPGDNDLSGFVAAQKKALLESYEAAWNEANSELRKKSEQFTEESLNYLADEAFDRMKAAVSGIPDELKKRGIEFGEDAEGKLQQGIQGITEDTAGALEAYMNGVSQQVYLHSDLLTQIRDAVVGFDLDVQLGVQSQILLELQNSYQVQMSIQNILQGVLTPSGRAFMVEME